VPTGEGRARIGLPSIGTMHPRQLGHQRSKTPRRSPERARRLGWSRPAWGTTRRAHSVGLHWPHGMLGRDGSCTCVVAHRLAGILG
jgi:hypothetical protein